MKEGISYSFLLNIIIVFIFVCSAIVMGIFSYYRAFRANAIIVNSIEKYEGYNCYSQKEISRKLGGISYNVPYDVACGSNYGHHCTTDPNKNYVVVAYNLDVDGYYYDYDDFMEHDNNMFSYIEDSLGYSDGLGNYTKKYQYGVYTYMYVDLPIISNFIRLSYFSKTKEMVEYRNLYRFANSYVDLDFIPSDKLTQSSYVGISMDISSFTNELMQYKSDQLLKEDLSLDGETWSEIKKDSRRMAQYFFENDFMAQAMRANFSLIPTSKPLQYFEISEYGCNTNVDYSKF